MKITYENIQKLLDENSIFGSINEINGAYVEILVELGDWKHDHICLDNAIAEQFEVVAKTTEITEEDGSDTYSAIHKYMLRELPEEEEQPEEIKVVIKRTGEPAEEATIKADLETYQELVGGYIECISLTDDIDIVCNEEGKLMGLEPNFKMPNDIIVGDVFFVGIKDEDFVSLTDERIELILRLFN